MKEIWKDVKGYEGFYQISSLCRIRSLDRRTTNNQFVHGKILIPILRNGYNSAVLCKRNTIKTKYLHVLFCTAFIPNPENLPCVNHKDSIRINNSFENLEWVNRRENQTHRLFRIKRSSQYFGVSYIKNNDNWRAMIRINNKSKWIGAFDTELKAHEAVQSALIQYGIKNKYAKAA